jgi:hypothetical protein
MVGLTVGLMAASKADWWVDC